MTCSKVQHLLSAWIDAELDGQSMLEIRQHLHSCSQCEQEAEQLRWVKQMTALPGQEPPAGFEERLAHRLSQERKTTYAGFSRWMLGAAAAAAAAAAVISISLVRQGNMVQPVRPTSAVAQPAAQDAAPAFGNSGRTVLASQDAVRERQYLMSSDPLSGPATAVAYADR